MQKEKKMKNILKIIGLLLVSVVLIPINKVNAQSFNDSFDDKYHWIPGDYVVKQSGNNKAYQQMVIMVRRSDGQFIYCLQPGTLLNENLTYTGYDDSDAYLLSNITKEQWQRVQLLAYYGYGYGNHTDQHWYSVTQFMIWQTVPRGKDIYFTDTLNGNRIVKYQSEMQELNNLVANHYKAPSFSNTNLEMSIGDTLTLTDSNGLLNNYNVTDSNNLNVSKDGNNLYITANNVGNTTVSLTKSDTRFSMPPIIYVDPNSQDVFVFGKYDPLSIKVNLNVIGGKVTINKTDVTTNKQEALGEATLNGAVYGVYKADGTKVGTLTTDNNGNVTSNYLPSLGSFYLREETPSNGYQLDSTNYYFEITKDNLYPTVKVYEKVINKDFEFTKVYADSKTGIMIPEANIEFGFYNNKGDLVTKATTDSNGRIKVNLVYSKYTVKQLTSTHNYEKVDDFTVEVYEMGDTVYKVISNAEITAKLKVIKIDKDTGNIITRAGIKFKIKNVDTNEYVCQKVTYPTAQTLCEYETDSNGVLITPYPLSSGKYILEEVDQVIDGYLWNKESIEFEIGENSELINNNEYGILFEVKYENKAAKGSLEINKTGEEVELTDNGFKYSEIALNGVKFGLYANADIFDSLGNLIYKKDTLIKELTTDENGNVKVSDLYLGKYYIKELETVNSHVLDNNKYEFELKYKDQYTEVIYKTLNLTNHLPKGTLEFTKTDFSTSQTLPNTLIEIYTKDDKLVYFGRTDSDGKIIINELPVGEYYIIEKEAPIGYEIKPNKMEFEITSDGEIVKCTMTDELIVTEVPNTNKDEFPIVELISLLLTGIGFGVLFYVKKKNK